LLALGQTAELSQLLISSLSPEPRWDGGLPSLEAGEAGLQVQVRSQSEYLHEQR